MTSSSASNSNSITSPEMKTVRRKSKDIGWEYGVLVDLHNLDKIKCKLCGKVFSGGVYRMKEHIGQITGNVTGCPKSTKDDQTKCRQAIADAKNKKRNKKRNEDEIRVEVNIVGEEDEMEELGSRKVPRIIGPMDKFALAINPDSSLSAGNTLRQQNIGETIFKDKLHYVHQYLARWVYEVSIPFNVIDNDSFKSLVEAIGQFGPGYKPPSQYQLREPLLKEEVERTKEKLKKQEEKWKEYGCSIVMDAWTDRKRRRIMNLCVNCNERITFISSKESSNEAHTGKHILEYVLKCIEQVGQENIVQVVTNNTSNNIAIAKMLKEKMPNIFWTSCATHTINHMLESIGKIPKFKKTIDMAKTFTIFIYAHHKTLSLMRSFTKKRNIVRSGITKFASSFLTLQSLMEKKGRLRAMFTSTSWEECRWAKQAKGKAAYDTVMDIDFWDGMALCLKVFVPLVNVLRLVGGNRKPSMGFLYGELILAKQHIKEALNNGEKSYQLISAIIDEKVKGRLDSPLHLTAYLLNPLYFFKDPSIQYDHDVIDGIFNCVKAFFWNDIDMQSHVINVELEKYKNKEGHFGKWYAVKGCEKNNNNYNPVSWWSLFGCGTRNLQKMALKILSLTSSSFGCERDSSTFEWMHRMKKNQLGVNQLNNLMFVKFNAKLKNKRKREKKMNLDVLTSSEVSNAQEWIVDGNGDDEEEVKLGSDLNCHMSGEASEADAMLQPRRSAINVEVREFHEDDFASDNEDEEEINFEFESDDEHTLKGYQEEELELGNLD